MRSIEKKRIVIAFLLIVGIILVWYLLLLITDFPEFILPVPHDVFIRLVEELIEGKLLFHLMITVVEFTLGLALGSVAAIIFGYWISHSTKVEMILSPILTASQAIPVVAIAPLLVLWFGPGLFSKVLVCAIIIFFPVLVNTIYGLKNIQPDLKLLFSTLHATRRDQIRLLEIPASLPTFLSGLKIGATLSVTGAIVGEFIGADKGLGYLINVARGQYDTAYVFAIIIVLIILALTLYHGVGLLEKKVTREASEDVLK